MFIRDGLITDLPAIVEIYNQSVPSRLATADLEPVTVESRLAWFKEHPPSFRPLWVMEKDNQIAGWLSFQSFYGRPAYKATAELSIYISPNFQRQGVGTQLLTLAIKTSPSLGVKTLLAFIFAHNTPSIQLFKKHHFESWGYFPQVADLDGMECDLTIMGRKVVKEIDHI